MNPTGPVHFVILASGSAELTDQHIRAIDTARVHGTPIWVWTNAVVGVNGLTHAREPVEIRAVTLPRWLKHHRIGLANVKDLYVWRILREHGGLYLDLDTISLEPVWDLLLPEPGFPKWPDVLVSREWPNEGDGVHQYNSAVVAARAGAPVLRTLYDRALTRLKVGHDTWGGIGPHLLTEVVADYPQAFAVADFGVLSGWRDDTIDEYYDGADPPAGTRIIHCYSSSRPHRFFADRRYID